MNRLDPPPVSPFFPFCCWCSSPVSDTIVGHAVVEEMGIVVGTSARSRSIIHDLIQRIRGIVGGSLTDYEVSHGDRVITAPLSTLA